jgi:hypothetical protein
VEGECKWNGMEWNGMQAARLNARKVFKFQLIFIDSKRKVGCNFLQESSGVLSSLCRVTDVTQPLLSPKFESCF